MTGIITILYWAAAILPIAAIAWNGFEAAAAKKKQDAASPGTRAYVNETNGAEWIRSEQKRNSARHMRELILVGGGVTLASVAGIVSLSLPVT